MIEQETNIPEPSIIPHIHLISEKVKCYLLNKQHKFVLTNFFINAFECDIFSVTNKGITNEYEIKRTLKDYKKDFFKKDGELLKHKLIQEGNRTHKFWYVIPEEWDIEIPPYTGIITYRYVGDTGLIIKKKRNAKILHTRNFQEDNILLHNIALKCYYRMQAYKVLALLKTTKTI